MGLDAPLARLPVRLKSYNVQGTLQHLTKRFGRGYSVSSDSVAFAKSFRRLRLSRGETNGRVRNWRIQCGNKDVIGDIWSHSAVKWGKGTTVQNRTDTHREMVSH